MALTENSTQPNLENNVAQGLPKPDILQPDSPLGIMREAMGDDVKTHDELAKMGAEASPVGTEKIHDFNDDDLKTTSVKSPEDQARLDQEKQDLGIGGTTTEDAKAALGDEASQLGVDSQLSDADKLNQTRENARINKDHMPPPDATPDAPWGKYPDGKPRPDPKTLPHDGAAQGLPPEPTAEQKALAQEKIDLGIDQPDATTTNTEAAGGASTGTESADPSATTEAAPAAPLQGPDVALKSDIGADVTDDAIRVGAEGQYPVELNAAGEDINKDKREAFIAGRTEARTAAQKTEASAPKSNPDQAWGRYDNDNTAAARDEQALRENRMTPKEFDIRQQERRDGAEKALKQKEADEKQKEAAQAKADKTIQEKYKNNEPLTADESKRLAEMQANKIEVTGTKKELEDKLAELKKNEPLSAEDLEKYNDLAKQLEEVKQSEKTPEQIEDERLQKMEDLGTEAFAKLLRGEDASEEILAFNNMLIEGLGVTLDKADEAAAREFVKGIMNPESAKSPAESKRLQEIKAKLQELAQLEMRIRNQAEVVKRMSKEEKSLVQDLNAAESDYINERNPDEKQRKMLVFSGKTLQLARYQDSIKVQKNMGRNALVQKSQIRGYIHRKLGTHNPIYNMMFGLGTAALQGRNAVLDGADAVFANFD